MVHSTIRTLASNALALCLLFAALGSSPAALDPPYFTIDPQLLITDTKRIEVAEVFSYACPHCAEFQARIDAWRKTLDTTRVEFMYLPAPYDQRDVHLARGYFSANILGIVEQTHHRVFEALHVRGIQVQSFDDVIRIYEQLGVRPDVFKEVAKSAAVDNQLRRTLDLMLKYKVDSTPTLIVAGKYRVTADSAGGQAEMLEVANRLIAKELAQSKATSRQAPSKGK